MEMTFDEGYAGWEITRYAGVLHGYTNFESDAYNLVADARSWESMMSAFHELMAVPEMTGAQNETEGTDPEETDPEDPEETDPPSGDSSANVLHMLVGIIAAVGLFVKGML
jgi:hypothetical protein